MIYSIIFFVLAALSYWYWSAKFVPTEVRENAADFVVDGANDTLQQGYHSRQSWSRLWPALACCVVPAAPLAFASWGAAALGFLAMVALIGGYFARWFTPLLNEARTATRPDITTWYASPDSKSWPDAKAWKETRSGKALMFTHAEEQLYANATMKSIILTAWLWCRIAAAAAAATAAWVAVAS